MRRYSDGLNYPLSPLRLGAISLARTDRSKSCPYVYTFIASQTINVSQTRITYHFSFITRHNVALRVVVLLGLVDFVYKLLAPHKAIVTQVNSAAC